MQDRLCSMAMDWWLLVQPVSEAGIAWVRRRRILQNTKGHRLGKGGSSPAQKRAMRERTTTTCGRRGGLFRFLFLTVVEGTNGRLRKGRVPCAFFPPRAAVFRFLHHRRRWHAPRPESWYVTHIA